MQRLRTDRSLSAKDSLTRLPRADPDAIPKTTTPRTSQQRIKRRRDEQVSISIFGLVVVRAEESNGGASVPTLLDEQETRL